MSYEDIEKAEVECELLVSGLWGQILLFGGRVISAMNETVNQDVKRRNVDSTAATRVTVERICISPGHNFFGRAKGEPGSYSTVEVQEVECVAGRGLRGDRFFDFKPDYKGQVTFF